MNVTKEFFRHLGNWNTKHGKRCCEKAHRKLRCPQRSYNKYIEYIAEVTRDSLAKDLANARFFSCLNNGMQAL